VRSPDLIVLDEPTSALDYDSERKIFNTIRCLARNCRVLVATHRFELLGKDVNIYYLNR